MPADELAQLFPDLRGRRAVVTGAANGIGLAIANRLIRCGARLVAIDKDADGLAKAFKGEPTCQRIPFDLSEDVDSLLATILDGECVELVVNNVGVSTEEDFLSIKSDALEKVLRTNLTGPWLLVKCLLEHFIEEQKRRELEGAKQPSCAVVFISSLHDHRVSDRPHYSVSKAGVATLAKELAWKFGSQNIRVNTVSPGWIRTARNLNSPQERRKYDKLQPRIALRKPGYPDDVARVVLMLLSDLWCGYLTGANIPVDGGLDLDTWRGD
jgi:glucose 1-dehydrogenase